MQYSVFFFNDTATTEIYTLSLHDALPIFLRIGDRLAAGDLADEDLAVLAEADDGRGEPVALLVLDHLRVAAFHDRDHGVRRSQVDSNDLLRHFVCSPSKLFAAVWGCRPAAVDEVR